MTGVSLQIIKLSGKSSREDMCRLRTYFRYQKYSKFRQTGNGHVADSKLSYTIQFSILMLCAKYWEAGLCGSWEKCDRNYCDADARRRIVIPICRLCITQATQQIIIYCNKVKTYQIICLYKFIISLVSL